MQIRVNFGGLTLLDKVAVRFGNGAHVLVPKTLAGRKVKIVLGDTRLISKKELAADFSRTEILERKAAAFGTGAHVIVPKEYAGKRIKVIAGDKNE